MLFKPPSWITTHCSERLLLQALHTVSRRICSLYYRRSICIGARAWHCRLGKSCIIETEHEMELELELEMHEDHYWPDREGPLVFRPVHIDT